VASVGGQFVDEQILFGAVIDAIRGGDGVRKVWEEGDDNVTRFTKGAKHIVENALIPGSVRDYRRISKAARGEVSPSGSAYALSDELLNTFVGLRLKRVNIQDQYQRNLNRLNRYVTDEVTKLNRTLRSRGTITAPEIQRAVRAEADARYRFYRQARVMTNHAETLGLSNRDINGVIRGSGLRADFRNSLLSGLYRGYEPTTQVQRQAREAQQRAQEQSGIEQDDRIRALRQAQREVDYRWLME